MNIVLSGMPLSGKSTVLEEFSKRGFPVFDSDAEIVKKHGSITEIFSRLGEGGFRDIESEIIFELSKKDGVIISLGGGSLIREKNAERLKRNGKIVYLKADIKTLLARKGDDESRPLLRGDAEKNLSRLYAERKDIFERAADITVITDDKTPQKIADEILEKLK